MNSTTKESTLYVHLNSMGMNSIYGTVVEKDKELYISTGNKLEKVKKVVTQPNGESTYHVTGGSYSVVSKSKFLSKERY